MGMAFGLKCNACGFEGLVQIPGGMFSKDATFGDAPIVHQSQGSSKYFCPKCNSLETETVSKGPLVFFD
jgi:predicted RNA-binding Zn-ribbon protein involved in translation (DUF1610 family)